jgi:hypothetical protein
VTLAGRSTAGVLAAAKLRADETDGGNRSSTKACSRAAGPRGSVGLLLAGCGEAGCGVLGDGTGRGIKVSYKLCKDQVSLLYLHYTKICPYKQPITDQPLINYPLSSAY